MSKEKWSRRDLLGSAAAGLASTIVPRAVLGGKGYLPPSDRLNIGYIGCGTQGLREMCRLVEEPAVQITSVCDPNRFSTDYIDWSPNGIRDGIRRTLKDASWGGQLRGIPGGREIGKELVEKAYAARGDSVKYKGCKAYADFRELLEREDDLDAVKIMTPDHLHAAVAVAAMKRGKHVVIHKPIANRVHEARISIEVARRTGVRTHLLAWSKRSGYTHALNWIRGGAIGNLREIHNWSNRPVWPQWTSRPADTPVVPPGLDWPLWLGPVPDRPYHPNYTHTVFRGWYDFGAGAIADMGTYSLWPLFLTFGFKASPISVEANGTTTCAIQDQVSRPVQNDVAFPHSSVIRFKFAEQGEWGPLQICWYDGGMKPPLPEEMASESQDFPREGMMFVGDRGKIVAGFRCESPRILSKKEMVRFAGSAEPPSEEVDREAGNWIESFRADKESPGSFLLAGPVTETILLGAVALRAGRRIEFDAQQMEVTNLPEANEFLRRDYRKGWEMDL